MSDTLAGLLQIALLFCLLAAVYVPLGDHMARVYSSTRHLAAERLVYRLCGVQADTEQRPGAYLRGVLAFSLLSILLVYLLQRVQQWLPLSIGMGPVDPDQAWNTAVSFAANTNWQSYSGEAAMSHLTQMAGLAVQNFLSAAVGMSVAMALVRGLIRRRSDTLGNFWVDLVRTVVRVLLPLSFAGALVLVAGGVVQNLSGLTEQATLGGGTQLVPGGPVASQEVIKELGTNGGGFFNANSAHPFENPSAWTNLFEIFLILLIPVSLTRTYGTLLARSGAGSHRHGLAILGAMATLFCVSLAATTAAEVHGGGAATQAAGAAMEGKEVRFGEWASALFATATTGTSTGAVNSFHDSFTPLGGGMVLFNMLLGEVTPGGVGSGLYGMLVLAMLAVFLGGLMIGRTPEYLGKRIGAREIKLIALFVLTTPALVLVGTGIAMALPQARASMGDPGAHGFTEVLYAFASGANNNGSAFAGLGADTFFYNTAIGLAMLFGRFLPIVFALTLAGALAAQQPAPVTAGTLPTHRPLFVTMVVATTVIVTGLTFFPALALGPIAEGLL
ncbi:potassium-transporting ATPase subunit KdpA [Marinactinospora thermotolerans]|uniref:Potassium-transporting ATPase potassium-binding subunit n=1 Tax=Marinactinospora thermotolerans DSM 45154 TaxID=1122192 RepID=A0A1T4QDG7_9ACTN|nr:potassium-transporting ATPase subunit KdpA [Marinactinospora thermotolerans]SKA01734.1 K+-transporting ATPase ATPase A chain [Marinactinospora thermotolerans DSM 45154]